MKTKQEVINEILESSAAYVRTSVSNEACAAYRKTEVKK
jgi:hypothetical protein